MVSVKIHLDSFQFQHSFSKNINIHIITYLIPISMYLLMSTQHRMSNLLRLVLYFLRRLMDLSLVCVAI